jgi:hypothetical protein
MIRYENFDNSTVAFALAIEDGKQVVKIHFSKEVKPWGRLSDSVFPTTVTFVYSVVPRSFLRHEAEITRPGGVKFSPDYAESLVDRSLLLDLLEQCPTRIGGFLGGAKDALDQLGRSIKTATGAKTRGRPRKDNDAKKTKSRREISATASSPPEA